MCGMYILCILYKCIIPSVCTLRTVTRYSDYTQPLVLSDLEELEGVKLREECTSENGE